MFVLWYLIWFSNKKCWKLILNCSVVSGTISSSSYFIHPSLNDRYFLFGFQSNRVFILVVYVWIRISPLRSSSITLFLLYIFIPIVFPPSYPPLCDTRYILLYPLSYPPSYPLSRLSNYTILSFEFLSVLFYFPPYPSVTSFLFFFVLLLHIVYMLFNIKY